MEKNPDILLKIRQISFTRNCIKITCLYSEKYQIFYKEIVFVCLRVYNRKTGEFYEPEIAEITENMEGDLFLYDMQCRWWRLQTNMSGKTAGAIFQELAYNAPYILLGRQPWFNIECEEDFVEIKNMVSIMRQC